MNLAFATKHLRSICESQSVAEREVGVSLARALKARLADLDVAENIDELVVGRRMPDGVQPNVLWIGLTTDAWLIIAANHNSVPICADGAVDWQKVSRVKVLRIEMTHDRK